ncbi:MAG: PQQ-binding-like beta-propeller repeat protein [Thermoleophilia bacterium]
MTRYVVAAAAALLLALAGQAVAAIPTAPGWPRTAPGGELLPGPDGGIVVVTTVARSATTRAWTIRGGLRWVQRSTFGCGNCDDGPQPEALQPDGTYGPIGVEGDDAWAVDRQGRRVLGCSGVVFPDGGCVSAPGSTSDSHPAFAGRPASGPPWRVQDPRWFWYPDSDVPAMVVRDAGGRIYGAFELPIEVATQRRLDGLLIAMDPVSRTIQWEREGPTQVLAALPSGVLAADADGVTAYGSDGAELWHRSVTTGQRVTPRSTIVDAARGRVYLGRAGGGAPGVTAVDLATGAQVWKTRPSDEARLLSVGRGGRVYVAIDARGRLAVRGLRLATGATAWQLRTNLAVYDALELAGGRVAVSAGNRFAPTTADRLTVRVPG